MVWLYGEQNLERVVELVLEALSRTYLIERPPAILVNLV